MPSFSLASLCHRISCGSSPLPFTSVTLPCVEPFVFFLCCVMSCPYYSSLHPFPAPSSFLSLRPRPRSCRRVCTPVPPVSFVSNSHLRLHFRTFLGFSFVSRRIASFPLPFPLPLPHASAGLVNPPCMSLHHTSLHLHPVCWTPSSDLCLTQRHSTLPFTQTVITSVHRLLICVSFCVLSWYPLSLSRSLPPSLLHALASPFRYLFSRRDFSRLQPQFVVAICLLIRVTSRSLGFVVLSVPVLCFAPCSACVLLVLLIHRVYIHRTLAWAVAAAYVYLVCRSLSLAPTSAANQPSVLCAAGCVVRAVCESFECARTPLLDGRALCCYSLIK